MANSATRLLVLGVVRAHGTAHGYLVRSELVSWYADEWANVKWGSIYHSLRQMTREGLLTAREVESGRVDYTITKKGETEYFRSIREMLRSPEYTHDALGAALAFLPDLPRHEAIDLLEQRLELLTADHTEITDELLKVDTWDAPEHVRELVMLWGHDTASNIAWTREAIVRLENGAYTMADDRDPGKK